MRRGLSSNAGLTDAGLINGRPPATGRRSLNARQRLARRARWRRWVTALLAAAAAALALSALAPRAAQSGGREVVVAVRDLPAGAVISSCAGYTGIPTPAVAATWGGLKAAYR